MDLSNITFTKAVVENNDEIIDFLNEHFLHHEPMNRAVALCEPGYRMPYFDRMVRQQLERADSLSWLAWTGNILTGVVILTPPQPPARDPATNSWQGRDEGFHSIFPEIRGLNVINYAIYRCYFTEIAAWPLPWTWTCELTRGCPPGLPPFLTTWR